MGLPAFHDGISGDGISIPRPPMRPPQEEYRGRDAGLSGYVGTNQKQTHRKATLLTLFGRHNGRGDERCNRVKHDSVILTRRLGVFSVAIHSSSSVDGDCIPDRRTSA